MKKYFDTNYRLSIIISIILVGFVVLSWWLLFRDERALMGIESFYPQLSGQLFPLRDWLIRHGLNVLPTVAFLICTLLIFLAYFLALKASISLRASILMAVIFQLIMFASYPILSTDIFSYMFADRVQTEYGQNVWKVTPDTFPNDPFEKLADWKEVTKVTGAISQPIYTPAAYLGHDDLFTTLYLYKLIVLLFSLGSLGIVIYLTKGLDPVAQAKMIRLVFWNPLFLLDIVGSGHNDGVMIFFLLAGLLLWKRLHLGWAGVFLALAVQVKLIPIIIFCFCCLHLLQKYQLRKLLVFSGTFLLVNIFSFWYMQVSPAEFVSRVLFNNSVYWQSLQAVLVTFWPDQQLPFLYVFALIIVILIYLQIKRSWDPLYTSAIALLVYLLFFSTAYWNWYVLWLLVIIPFLKQIWIKNTILIFTFTSLAAYPLLWFSYRYGFGHPFWLLVTYLVVFGIPIAVMWRSIKNKFSLL